MKSSEVIEGKKDDTIDLMRQLDGAIKTDAPAGPLPADAGQAGPAPAAGDEFNGLQFLQKTVQGIVAAIPPLTKAAKFKHPFVMPPMTDEQWVEAVTAASVATIQKHLPSLVDAASPELMLLVLLAPGILLNFKDIVGLFRGKSDSNTGGNGDRKNNDDAKVAEPTAVSTNVPN